MLLFKSGEIQLRRNQAKVPWLDKVLLVRLCVREPTTGVTERGTGLMTGVAKVGRWLNQPRGRRMVLMPTV